MKIIQTVIIATLLNCSVTATALSYTIEDSYIASSSTAVSITGDIQMDDFSITFANGETLEFSELVADHFSVNGKTVPASLYRVSEPADPVLENDNQLCGSGDVTYIATWGNDPLVTNLAVFTGGDAPADSSEMCASYVYEIAP